MLEVKCRLAVLMAERKIKSQAELSRMSGIRKNTIADYYNETSASISFQDMAKLCEVLKCNISDIFVLEETDSPQD